MLLNELTRIQSHLVWLGTHAMDIGALTVFLYCFREREEMLKIFEHVSGQRMMGSYFRVGGVVAGTAGRLLRAGAEPAQDHAGEDRRVSRTCSPAIQSGSAVPRASAISRAEDAIALGVTGPPLRASGVDWDLRRDMPYSGYEKFQFKVPISNDCDVWARYIMRVEEMRESVKICQQALDGMPGRPASRPTRPRSSCPTAKR